MALGLTLLSGCAKKRTVRRPPPPPPAAPAKTTPPPVDTRPAETARPTPPPAVVTQPPAPAAPLSVETGIASWYGHPYHGRIAANGERYDMEDLTAAHRTLPFETRVRVVNTLNEKTVDVRITDRGPFVDGRIIDLSRAAARAIELIGPGIAPVRVEITSIPETVRAGVFAVQVGAFRAKENAERARIQMAAKYGAARIVQDDDLWRVLVGAEKTEERADELCRKIRQESGERNAFVVRLDS